MPGLTNAILLAGSVYNIVGDVSASLFNGAYYDFKLQRVELFI